MALWYFDKENVQFFFLMNIIKNKLPEIADMYKSQLSELEKNI